MPKKQPDLAALGHQYRDAKAAIAEHRARQAVLEVEHSRLVRRLGYDHPDVETARTAVAAAVADVQWCRAVVVAAGEAYKGVSFDDAVEDRSVGARARERAVAAATKGEN